MSSDTAVQQLLHKACQAEFEGRFDDAVALLRRALDYTESPLALDVRLRLGKRLVLLRRGDEAGTVLAEARAAAAERHFRADLELARRLRDPAGVGQMLNSFGELLEGRLTARAKEEFTRAQQVTVLFSDVRNYTTLSEGLAPAAVVELLNEWFAEATRVIRRHGGLVDKFIGDAVMALFGVPEPRDDAAADAVRAALGLRDVLSALNLRSQALGGREIQVGIGVHTGEAVVGFIGSHLRLSYTAIGDTVNVASRLESATKALGCDILISQKTEEGQRRYRVAETQPRGLAELKGRSSLPVYSVDAWGAVSRAES